MGYQIEKIFEIEEELIKRIVFERQQDDSNEVVLPSDYELNKIYKIVHVRVVNTLINSYLQEVCMGYTENCFSKYFEGVLNKVIIPKEEIQIENIPSLCEDLHINYLNSTFVFNKNTLIRKKSKNNLIEIGAVYTQDQIAYSIVDRTLSSYNYDTISNIKILDFATGTGRFYRQVVACLFNRWGVSSDDAIANNIYAVDVDPTAVNICRLYALAVAVNKNVNVLKTLAEHILCKNALIREQLFDNGALTAADCDGLFNQGFDVIVSNPPYLVLKPNKSKMDSVTVKNINKLVTYFRNSTDYRYSIEGMLNLYQISIESMIGMLKSEGKMGIICPSTLFADISAKKLRKYILTNHCVSYIKYFKEEDPLFDNVTQATCIFNVTKNIPTNNIDIEQHGKSYNISITDIKKLFSANWEIPSIEKIEWDILKKLQKIKKLKDNKYIRNKRGELDLTLYKDYITLTPTKLRLVRGNMISGNSITNGNNEFVDPKFLKLKSSDYINNDFNRKRLICQQISNQSQKIRLKFVLSEKNDIMGNSCNYITVPDENIEQILVLLNSALLNWRFKITSTNNHVNNYELDELPIIDLNLIDFSILKQEAYLRDKAICKLYGLGENEINYIVNTYYEAL